MVIWQTCLCCVRVCVPFARRHIVESANTSNVSPTDIFHTDESVYCSLIFQSHSVLMSASICLPHCLPACQCICAFRSYRHARSTNTYQLKPYLLYQGALSFYQNTKHFLPSLFPTLIIPGSHVSYISNMFL